MAARTKAQLEASLEAYFFREVRVHGGMPIKLCPNVAGLPDRLVMFPGGRVYFVELKTEIGTVRTAQTIMHDRMAELGRRPFVLYGRLEVDAWIVRVLDTMGPQTGQGRKPTILVDRMFDDA